MTEKEIKALIGAAVYKKMKAFAKAEKKQGRSATDVKRALLKKFGKRLKTVNSSLIVIPITGIRHRSITGTR